MKRARYRQLLVLTLVGGASLGLACGETESKQAPGTESTATGSSGGAGGGGSSSTGGGGEAGASQGPQSMMCDGSLCEGLSLGIPGAPETDACCPETSAGESCGVKTDFLLDFGVELSRSCQPLHSPGELDDSCPVSPPVMVSTSLSLTFPGCCLPSGKCGFMLDSVLNGAIPLNLGCLDATELPNPDLSDPPDCGSGVGGEGGAGGAG